MTDAAPRRSFWHTVWPALIVAAVVLLARGAFISLHQSERYDDSYHLNRGIAFLRGDVGGRVLNDPPLGEAIGALPLFVTGSYDANPANDRSIYGHRLSPETLLLLVALWKSLLFLPLIAVAFVWARDLYGVAAANLSAALLLIEPTFAAHAPLPSVDVIGVEGIVIAAFAVWRFATKPTWPRAIAMAALVALAMLMKNTALILPGIAFVMIAIVRSREWRTTRFGRGFAMLGVAVVVSLFCLWAFSLFDVSTPIRKKDAGDYSPTVAKILRAEWPAGSYVRSIVNGVQHAREGHNTFLNGHKDWHGTWRYFPIVATYKLPIGVMAMLALGALSLVWRRLRFEELSLAIPAIAYTLTLLNTDINIGFRHFLPALAFWLMGATRVCLPSPCGRGWGRGREAIENASELRMSSPPVPPPQPSPARGEGAATTLAIACCAVAAIETSIWLPNELSFTNALRGPPWLKLTDSNVDWGQSLPALRKWADARDDGRPIAFAYFGSESPGALEHWLGGSRVRVVMKPPYKDEQPGELPTRGWFVVSPVALTGVYDRDNRLKPLWDVKPKAVIDGALLVYDLDTLPTPIEWPRVRGAKK